MVDQRLNLLQAWACNSGAESKDIQYKREPWYESKLVDRKNIRNTYSDLKSSRCCKSGNFNEAFFHVLVSGFHTFKDTLLCFWGFSLSSTKSCIGFCFSSAKTKSHTLAPCLKHLHWTPLFTSETLWHHYVTPAIYWLALHHIVRHRWDIFKRLTNHYRAGQLTNQSRLGSGFRQRVKRGAAAQAVWEELFER